MNARMLELGKALMKNLTVRLLIENIVVYLKQQDTPLDAEIIQQTAAPFLEKLKIHMVATIDVAGGKDLGEGPFDNQKDNLEFKKVLKDTIVLRAQKDTMYEGFSAEEIKEYYHQAIFNHTPEILKGVAEAMMPTGN